MRKKAVFAQMTKTKRAIHTVMVTSAGVAHNAFYGEIQNEVVMDDLFDK